MGGGVRQAIGFSEMKRIPILLPPIEEQKEIVRYIQGESAKMEIAIRRLEKEIELIKEYRQSIIAEVVTGKLDIGNAKSKEYKMPSTPLALAAED